MMTEEELQALETGWSNYKTSDGHSGEWYDMAEMLEELAPKLMTTIRELQAENQELKDQMVTLLESELRNVEIENRLVQRIHALEKKRR